MANLPQRTNTHEIDTEACKIVATKISRNWEIRDLTGRDFGVDKIIERFQNGEATGEMIMLQIKGTESEIDSDNPRFSLETKTLQYAEMFASPFLLVYCSINNPEQCYYVWLQEYIRVRLNFENENWRNQDTNTIYFPQKNVLGTKICEEHLTYISKFPKFKDSWIQYYLSLVDVDNKLSDCFCYEEMSLGEIKLSVYGITEKLQKAMLSSKNIPKKYFSKYIIRAIELVQKFQDMEEKPMEDEYFELIQCCHCIKASIEMLAMRFDSKHLRLLYDFDGTADF